MKGTITGVLPDPSAPAPKGPVKASWWKRRHTFTRRTLVGLALGAAILGGVLEKAAMDSQVADLQAQVAAMQGADTTGASSNGDVTISHKTPTVQHPKALSPSQHRYQCTKVG